VLAHLAEKVIREAVMAGHAPVSDAQASLPDAETVLGRNPPIPPLNNSKMNYKTFADKTSQFSGFGKYRL